MAVALAPGKLLPLCSQVLVAMSWLTGRLPGWSMGHEAEARERCQAWQPQACMKVQAGVTLARA